MTTAVVAQPNSRGSDPVLLDSQSASKLLLTVTKPEYPTLAKLNYIQGRVRLHVRVTHEGQVWEVRVLQGHPFLAASALETVRRWRYRPLIRGSNPVPFSTVVEVRFALLPKKLKPFPDRPEEDLSRAVHPPRPLEQPAAHALASVVRMRVLISDQGQVMDAKPLRGRSACFEAARESVGRWTFQPARWGSIVVPWYLDVDVAVGDSSSLEPAGRPCSGGS